MTTNEYLSISEFANLSGINRKNLIYYDNIGLLSPVIIRENGYRYYTYPQLDTVSVIIALKEIGVPLKAIKEYLDNKSPELLTTLFRKEQRVIKQKMERLQQIKDMMNKRLYAVASVTELSIDEISIQTLEEERIFLGNNFMYDNKQVYNGFQDFSSYCYEQNIVYGYPLGVRIGYKDVKQRNTTHCNMNYFYTITPELSSQKSEVKPAGKYLVAYSKSYLANEDNIFTSIFDYIEQNHLTIKGDCYIENILDEISVSNDKDYLSKIFILVE